MIFYKPSFNLGIVGRYLKSEKAQMLESGEKPKFGFYYWRWLPAIYTNGGRFRACEIVDINFGWLCFFGSLTFWPGKPLIPTLTRGQMIPWGLCWHHSPVIKDVYGNRMVESKRRLVLMFPIPLYSRRIPDNPYSFKKGTEEVFGFHVCRIRFWSDLDFFWLEDREFCKDMINQPPVYGKSYLERWSDEAAKHLRESIDEQLLAHIRSMSQ